MIKRIIPSSGEEIPVIGLGTWQTFDVDTGKPNPALTAVLSTMKEAGSRLIDSSPMYGKAEEAVGTLTSAGGDADFFFYATKVWTSGKEEGIKQMEASFKKMKRSRMDLLQIHNLVDWKTHLQTLKEWKSAGKIRYIGITHYTDDMHDELKRVISTESIDFVQFNYSIFSRHAEKGLLDAAANGGVATLINRPFGEGKLFARVRGKPLPPWAAEAGMANWSTYFLKYILAHPAVTCIIPATANPEHAAANFNAGHGELPDPSLKKKMLDYLSDL